MTLEMEPLELAMSELAQSGWKAGSSYDPVADAELMDEDKVEATKRAERKSKSGFFTCELQLEFDRDKSRHRSLPRPLPLYFCRDVTIHEKRRSIEVGSSKLTSELKL